MDENKFNFFGQTDIGRKKENNEDAFVAQPIWNDNLFLAVVIDGVGGYDGGEVAAEIAQKEIPSTLEASSNGERIDLLAEAVTAANNAIFERRKVEFPNMSCVLSAIIIDAELNQINMVHVGDTRVYQFHDSELRKLSHDHSVVGYMEEIGRLSEEQAMNHPERNVISRDVGSKLHRVGDDDFIESNVFPLLPNSVFLLCSDGLTDLVTSAEIISILEQSNLSLEKKVNMLVDLANKKGGKDNITVVLVDCKGIKEEPKPMPIVGSDESNNADDKNAKTNENQSDDSGKKNMVGKRLIIALVIFIVAFSLGVLLGFLLWHNPIDDSASQDEKIIPEGRLTIDMQPNDESEKYVIYDTVFLSVDADGNNYYSKYQEKVDSVIDENFMNDILDDIDVSKELSQEQIYGLYEQLKKLQSVIENLNSQMDRMNNQLSSKQNEINNLNNQLSAKQREIDNLKKNQNVSSSSDLAAKQKEIDSLNSQLTEKQNEIDSLKARFDALQKEVEALQKTLRSR